MNEVAKIILQQLGGNKFAAMTGAKNFVAGENFLRFKLPKTKHFVKSGINYIEVILTPMDDYTIVLGIISGLDYTEVTMVSGIYFDQLQEVFTAHTGLDTKL